MRFCVTQDKMKEKDLRIANILLSYPDEIKKKTFLQKVLLILNYSLFPEDTSYKISIHV